MDKNSNIGACIFLCSSETQQECLDKNLFGGKMGYENQVKKVVPGDKLLLYNYNTLELHGLFEATSESGKDIDPTAWGGKFPFQVRMKRIEEYHPLYRRDFENIMKFGKFPPAKISTETMHALWELFQGTQSLPQDENLFRKDYPANKYAEDGHWVRSLGELAIDNWLFNKLICHGYERKVPIVETLYCDWCFPLPNSRDFLYMEFWGMEEEKYLTRRGHKLELYKKHDLKLIELDKSCLENLDDVLPRKLRPYFMDHKF